MVPISNLFHPWDSVYQRQVVDSDPIVLLPHNIKFITGSFSSRVGMLGQLMLNAPGKGHRGALVVLRAPLLGLSRYTVVDGMSFQGF